MNENNTQFPTEENLNELNDGLSNAQWTSLWESLGVPPSILKEFKNKRELLNYWRQHCNCSDKEAVERLYEKLKPFRQDLAEDLLKEFLFVEASRRKTEETTRPVGKAASGSSCSTETAGIQKKDKPDGSSDNSGQEAGPEFPKYPMNPLETNPRGLCLIINNVNFEGRADSKLPGCEADEARLRTLFEDLRFDVQVENDKSADQMREVFNEVSNRDHSQYDCFVCCIMSHGKLGAISGSDDKYVEIQRILKYFKDVNGLIGKPKLFFIQACQGSGRQDGVIAAEATVSKSLGLGSTIGLDATVPREADFLLGYATVTGFVAYLTVCGSYYMRDLVDEMRNWHRHTDLLTILTAVNERLSRRKAIEKGEGPKPQYQIGEICSTLRKHVYL